MFSNPRFIKQTNGKLNLLFKSYLQRTFTKFRIKNPHQIYSVHVIWVQYMFIYCTNEQFDKCLEDVIFGN